MKRFSSLLMAALLLALAPSVPAHAQERRYTNPQKIPKDAEPPSNASELAQCMQQCQEPMTKCTDKCGDDEACNERCGTVLVNCIDGRCGHLMPRMDED